MTQIGREEDDMLLGKTKTKIGFYVAKKNKTVIHLHRIIANGKQNQENRSRFTITWPLRYITCSYGRSAAECFYLHADRRKSKINVKFNLPLKSSSSKW